MSSASSRASCSLLRLLTLLTFIICTLQFRLFHSYVDVSAVHHDFNHFAKTSGQSIEDKQKRSITNTHSYHHNENNVTDAIVYLAQFKDHSTYGVQYDAEHNALSGISKLNRSLHLLHINYVNYFPSCDVIVFHDATDVPSEHDRLVLSKNRPRVQFRQLDGKWWELPYGLQERDKWRWKRTAFSVGYRHMMRWFAVLIWDYLHEEGYTHVMVSNMQFICKVVFRFMMS